MSKKIKSGNKDITEAVQILYDMAHSSMDWGSGMLDNEEIEAVIGLAVFMGWQVPSLPGNSEPMVTVARKFPDHYEIKFEEVPARSYSQAYTRARITTKKAPA